MSPGYALFTTLTPSLGFHRTLSVTIPHFTAEYDECTRHLYLNLPPAMFIDPYELALYHDTYSFEYWGTRDLERPVTAVSQADSLVLISPHLYSRDVNRRTQETTIDIPIHSRYGDLRLYEKSGGSPGYQEVKLERPRGFMRCPISPTRDNQLGELDGIPLQIERHFNISDGFILSSFPATQQPLQLQRDPLVVHIPLGDPSHTFLVEIGTALVVLLCFVYVAWGASQCATRIYGERVSDGASKAKQKAGKVKLK